MNDRPWAGDKKKRKRGLIPKVSAKRRARKIAAKFGLTVEELREIELKIIKGHR
jgi:hypothetical protein